MAYQSMGSEAAPSLEDLRHASAASEASRAKNPFGAFVGFKQTAGSKGDAALIKSPTADYGSSRADAESLLPKMAGVGGGLAGAALMGERPSRRKISRYWRLQRGTVCFRFTLLLLSILIVFAGYFAFDLPSITAEPLKERLGINNEQLGVLFAVYAFPNAIIPMLSGAFFSRVGKWTGVVIIASVITSGVVLTGIGVLASWYWLMVMGRIIYGMGGESVYVGVEILVTKWFKGAEVGLAYGLIQAAGQAGSFSAFYLAPPLDDALGGIHFVYVASMVVTGSALAALATARILEITAYGVKEAKAPARGDAGDMHHSTGVMHSSSAAMAAAVLDMKDTKKSKDAHGHGHGHGHGHAHTKHDVAVRGAHEPAGAGKDGATAHKVRGESTALVSDDGNAGVDTSRIVEEDDEIFVEKYDDFDLGHDDDLAAELEALSPCPGIPVLHAAWRLLGLSHLRKLKWDFWCVLGSIACYSSAFYTFLAFGNVWLATVFHYDDSQSGQTVGIVSIFSMVISPIIGVIMDKRGGQRYAAFLAMSGACFFFGIMGFTDAPPIASVLLAGACYAVLPSALYPLLVETVPDEAFTPVYALVNSCINLVLTAAYYFAGAITNVETDAAGAGASGPVSSAASRSGHLGGSATSDSDFKPIFIMFCCVTGIGVVFTFLLARQQWLGRVGYQSLQAHH